MKRIFISQPMAGKSDREITAERQEIIDLIVKQQGEDIEIIDSFIEGAPYKAKPLWFLGKSLELLSTADAAFFAAGWDKARGCRIEHAAAVEYGIEIIRD